MVNLKTRTRKKMQRKENTEKDDDVEQELANINQPYMDGVP